MSRLMTAFALVFLAGCVQHVQPVQRIFIPNINGQKENSPTSGLKLDNPLSNSSVTACERLSELSQSSNTSNREYQFLSDISVDGSGTPNGALDIAKSPFIQYLLGEDAQSLGIELPSKKDFLKKVDDAYAKGQISYVQWKAVHWAAYVYDHQESLQYRLIQEGLEEVREDFESIREDQTNSYIEQTFPGIFGKSVAFNQSLYFLLLHKLDPTLNLGSAEIANILKTQFDLFSASDWAGFRDDAKITLSAAIQSYPFNPQVSQDERLCGYLLMKRSFTQMLAVKGYLGVGYQRSSQGLSTLPRLTQRQTMFPQIKIPGGFVDPQNNRVILSKDMIQNYDPSKSPLFIAVTTPQVQSQNTAKPADLTSELDFLEGLIYNFEATSPAAPWAGTPSQYLLGDIQSTTNRAVIPADAHSLALGLIVMAFKDLANSNIVQVDGNYAALQPNESAMGAVLLEPDHQTVKLDNLVHMTQDVVLLDQSLQEFVDRHLTPDQWTAMNSVYSKVELASIFGTDMFSPGDLAAILPDPQQRSTILKASLESLRFPLASLIIKMVNANTSAMTWSPDTGLTTESVAITKPQLHAAKIALEQLAINSQSPMLLGIAQKIQE